MRTVGAVLVASLALAACGGGGGDGGDAGSARPADPSDGSQPVETGGAGGGANGSPACGLLTTDEVGDLFGEPATVVPPDRDVPVAGGSDSCLWQASADDDASPTIYQLQLSVFSGNGDFDPEAWGDDAEAIDGLGDEAFLVRAGVLGTTAGYRRGVRSVLLSYAIPVGQHAPDSAAQADQVVDLLRTVDARLRSP